MIIKLICILVLHPDIENQILQLMLKAERGWQCGQVGCDYVAKQKGHLRNHVESNHVEIAYHCNYCHKICPTNNALIQHIKKYHKS